MLDFISYIDKDDNICAECKKTKRTISIQEQGSKLRIVQIDLGIIGAEYYSEVHTIDNRPEEISKLITWLTKRE